MSTRSTRRAERGPQPGDPGATGDPGDPDDPAQGGRAPDDPESVARTICLQLLAGRARTRSELATVLRRRGVPDDAAGRVLDRFGAVGLVDDGAYAEQWVRTRHEQRGLGRRALAVELRRKGVADETVAGALGPIDREAEQQRARALVDRRLRTIADVGAGNDEAAGRRLVGLLARKGYPAGLAYEVVREALTARGASLPHAPDTSALDDE